MLAQMIFLQRKKKWSLLTNIGREVERFSKQIAAQGRKNCASFEPDSIACETCTLTVL